MTRDRALRTLAARRDDLRRRHVTRAAVFGSVARGDDNSESDVDVLVEFAPDARVTLYDYAAVKRLIAEAIGGRVDVIDRANLDPRIVQRVDRDAVYAF